MGRHSGVELWGSGELSPASYSFSYFGGLNPPKLFSTNTDFLRFLSTAEMWSFFFHLLSLQFLPSFMQVSHYCH